MVLLFVHSSFFFERTVGADIPAPQIIEVEVPQNQLLDRLVDVLVALQ